MRLKKKRLVRWLLYFAIVCLSSNLAFLIQSSPLGSWVELRTYDLRFKLRGPLLPSRETPITILSVDEESLSRIPEPLMFWQKHFARVIGCMAEADTGTIGLDFLLSDAAGIDPEGQQALFRELLKAKDRKVPVILAYPLRDNQPGQSLPFLIGALGEEAFAYVNLTTDSDDFVRRQEIKAIGEDNRSRPGLALAVASAFSEKMHKPLRPISGDQTTILINYRGLAHFGRIPFARATEAAEKQDSEFFKRNFRDRIVLIGRIGDEDLHPTPLYYWVDRRHNHGVARTPGVDIHANVIATLLEGNFIQELKPRQHYLITLSMVALASFFCFRFTAIVGVSLSALIVAVYLFLALYPIFGRGWWFFVVSPVTGVLQAVGLAGFVNYVLEGREKQMLRNLFKRYVNDHVVTKILESPEAVALQGERKQITVLFADIRNFTTRTENESAERLVSLLNRYFTCMVQEIHARHGLVDKFIGDGMMAIFGAPLEDPEAVVHAVEAAQAMQRALVTLNQQFSSEGRDPIHIGIGIDTGDAVIGSIGSQQKMEYTAIGDVVNTASRIEGLNKELNSKILISGKTYHALQGKIAAEYVGDKELRGKGQAVPVYRILHSL